MKWNVAMICVTRLMLQAPMGEISKLGGLSKRHGKGGRVLLVIATSAIFYEIYQIKKKCWKFM